MPPQYSPNPPGHPSALRHARDAEQRTRADHLREAVHRAQRAFVAVNLVPFVVGIVLSCFTDVPAVAVYGKLTLGLVWGVLQCVLFVATAWWYENRSTRVFDPVEDSLTARVHQTEVSGAVTGNGSPAVTR